MARTARSEPARSNGSQGSQVHSFVCRVWREDNDRTRNDCVWRGRLIHLPSGRETYFQHLETVPRQMERLLGEPTEAT